MYKEEKMIGGILCHRSTPDGEWQLYNIFQLSEMVVKLRLEIAKLSDPIEEEQQ